MESIVAALGRRGGGVWSTQRARVRYAVLCQALLWRMGSGGHAGPIRGQLVNLSNNGLGLLVGTPLIAGEAVVFEMTVAGVGHVQWKCNVRWSLAMSDGTYRIGARITELTPANV